MNISALQLSCSLNSTALSGGARAVGWIKDEGVPSPSDALEAERLGRQLREDLDYELVRDREDRQSRCRPAAPFHLDKTSAAQPTIRAAAPGYHRDPNGLIHYSYLP